MRVADARAFRALRGDRYTLELAQAPTRAALAPLVDALAATSGTLHLVVLRGPEGPAVHALWSDFPTPEAARAARDVLPPDAAITSGWPRRIGPLQSELAGDQELP
ncbi:hypothetical protein ACQQ2N_00495 [Dokdonella sp. MW10]|uniref:hypothetical protein n=1 Tax=Dokdonella sp. MW10 TaxID=2992926 RepID=UPI003F7F5CE4